MNKEIIVQSNEDETLVAVLEDKQLVEIYIERSISDRLVGSIFKGKVKNVLPGMQAAFVDIGLEKNAFLYVEDAYDESLGEKGTKLNIRDILKEGQEIIVQVSKEPIGSKGPRVTRQLTLPGRYMVLMPQMDYIGISRRINDEEERERLKNIAAEIKPEQMGIIVRTAAEGASQEELTEDLVALLRTWERIMHRGHKSGAPVVIHKDLELVERILRDVVTDDVMRINVNNNLTYEKIIEVIGFNNPLKFKVTLSQEDLFSKNNLHQELIRALKRKVWLKSGGYIVIDQTEALVSIDVNTGKYVGSVNLEDTVLKTNLEAAVEIARQLRLRNIGGIIIIDFIDMTNEESQQLVLNKLEEEIQKDKVKAHILGITALGLVEMTRKKIRHSLSTSLERMCPCCDGKGRILSERTIAIKIKEEIKEIADRTLAEGISVITNPGVAAFLIGPSGNILKQLEEKVKKKIIIRGKENIPIHEYDIQAVYGDINFNDTLAPIMEHQLIKVLIEEKHWQRSKDGIGRFAGFVIDIENAGNRVGQEVVVEIIKIYRTYAKAVIVE